MIAPTGRPPRAMRVCSVAGCGRHHYGHGYCASHWARWRRHGDARADVPLRTSARAGGSYSQSRSRLVAERGRADRYGCADCGRPARCWSYDGADPDERREPTHGVRYSLDVDHYRPLCWSCHRRATGTPWRSPADRATMRTRRAVQRRSAAPGCTVPGCAGRHAGHGYCQTHLSRLQRVGDVRADVPIEHKRTHGKVSYWSVHERLRVERGPAAVRACADCGRTARSWSYDGADPEERTSSEGYRYSLDLDRYRPRCQPCHRRATNARTGARPGSALADVEQAAWLYERGVSAAGVGAVLGVSRTTVLHALRASGVAIRPRGTRAPLGRSGTDGERP